MNIGEVEKLTKVSKKTIRFYEEQELLNPKRADNGYRIYSEEDIRALEEIKFLRNLSMPLEKIKKVREGNLTLAEAMNSHMAEITKEQEHLEKIKEFGRAIAEKNPILSEMDFSEYEKAAEEIGEARLCSMEEFNANAIKGSNMAAILFILFMAIFAIGFVLIPVFDSTFPLWVLLLIEPFFILPIAGTVWALKERKRELRKGEIFDASVY